MTTPIVTPYPNTLFENRLHRFQRQRDLALRGLEKHRMSPQLAEALRAEIREALEAGGKPFDVVIARRVYDLAIAAKDMCAAATAGTGEAIKLIADVGGPIESLGELEPGAPAVQAQASETFGARIMRELMAMVKPKSVEAEDPQPLVLVHALAAARRNSMTDVAEALEVKLFGSVLTGSKPIDDASPSALYEHGYADGKAGAPPTYTVVGTPYNTGYHEGTKARFLDGARDVIAMRAALDTPHAFEARTTDRWKGPPKETCEHCGTDPRNSIHDVEALKLDEKKLDEKQSVWPKGVTLDEAERLYKENLLEMP